MEKATFLEKVEKRSVPRGGTASTGVDPDFRQFFGSFFQKRTAFFPTFTG